MIILISIIISIDSFFISSLVSGNKKVDFTLIVFSPAIHTFFVLIGIILEKRIVSFVSNNFLMILTTVIILAGFYLFVIYKPQKISIRKFNSPYFPELKYLFIILIFCALDAFTVGIVFGFWNLSITRSLITIFTVNLIFVLIPIFIKKIQSAK